ncbi:MAG: hypothetical protein JWO67_938, partial [Streptosporangiaceae bacterium]|nr:hypothetical protein [Streptosporangiaceae bacterium]
MRRTELSRASDRRRGAAERAGSTFTEPSGGLQRRGRIRPFSRKRARAMRERRDL